MDKSKKRSISRTIFLALFASVLIFTQAMAASAKTFPDVPKTSDYYSVVDEISDKGYVKGFDDGNFHPEVLLDRVQGALVFSRILLTDTDNLTKEYFTDVPKEYRFYKEVSGIARDGIINGYPDGTFRLYEPLTRGQVAILIYNTFDDLKSLEKVDIPFTDVKGTKYEDAVTALYAAGITKGISANEFGTSSTIKRGDFLLLLSKTLEFIHGDKEIKDVNVKVNDDQTATVSGHIKNFKLDGTEIVNIKVVSKADNGQKVNKDVKPDANQYFTFTTDFLPEGDYEAKVSVVGSKHTITKEFTVHDAGAAGVSIALYNGKDIVGNVLDLLDLKTDLTVRYSFSTQGADGAKVGDKLTYTISSDKGGTPVTKTIELKQVDIDRGYYEDVISANSLQTILGSVLGDTVGKLLGGGLLSTASTDVSAAAVIPAEEAVVTSAGLLDLGGLLGGITGTVGKVVGDVTGTTGEGATDPVSGLVGGITGDNADGLLGLPVTGILDGVVEVVDGVVVTVVDGVVVQVLDVVTDGLVGGLLGGLTGGTETVTITAQITDEQGNKGLESKEVYKFQLTDVVGL